MAVKPVSMAPRCAALTAVAKPENLRRWRFSPALARSDRILAISVESITLGLPREMNLNDKRGGSTLATSVPMKQRRSPCSSIAGSLAMSGGTRIETISCDFCNLCLRGGSGLLATLSGENTACRDGDSSRSEYGG